MRPRYPILALCAVMLLAACHRSDNDIDVLPTPAPTPCENGRTRAARNDCLKVCKKGCVDRFPLGNERRGCLDACRVSCFEQFPPGCLGDPGSMED